MFTGIVECMGRIRKIRTEGGNKIFDIEADIAPELSVDESVAHNGVCLTVTHVKGNIYSVTAVQETLEKTSLKTWEVDDYLNLERAMIMGARLDGHIVQGHVDSVGKCIYTEKRNGSWIFGFEHQENKNSGYLTVEKGSITVNGVSLTAFNTSSTRFQVTIIPYTYEHTGFKTIKVHDEVNLEFDIIGKYVAGLLGR